MFDRSTLSLALLALTLPSLLSVGACTNRRSERQRAEVVRPRAAPEEAPAPETFTVRLDTTKGPVHLEVHPEWAPLGAARFRELVQSGYYTDVAFFRVVEGFMAQVGIHGDPAMNNRWRNRTIRDDPRVEGVGNARGTVSYATSGANTRTTQFFINFVDNSMLDGMGFTPFARVRPADMQIVDQLYAGYGEGAPRGRGPSQGRMQSEGNTYLRAEFPAARLHPLRPPRPVSAEAAGERAPDVADALRVAEDAARAAGEIALAGFRRGTAVKLKGAIDLVTEYDLQAERSIRSMLSQAYPEHAIVGEEHGRGGGREESARLVRRPHRWHDEFRARPPLLRHEHRALHGHGRADPWRHPRPRARDDLGGRARWGAASQRRARPRLVDPKACATPSAPPASPTIGRPTRTTTCASSKRSSGDRAEYGDAVPRRSTSRSCRMGPTTRIGSSVWGCGIWPRGPRWFSPEAVS